MYLRSEVWCCSSVSSYYHPSDKRKNGREERKGCLCLWMQGVEGVRMQGGRKGGEELCMCVCMCVGGERGRRRYQITPLPLCPLCCLLALSVLCTSKLNLSWEGANSGAWGTGHKEGGLPALLHQSSGGPRGAELATDDDKPDVIRDWVRTWASMYVCVRWGWKEEPR